MTLKVVIATPSARPALTGNATTADRWARGLRARGHEVTVLAVPSEWRRADFERALPAADVVHLLHAWKCGRFVDEARAKGRVVVSFAGTDLDPALESARSRVVRHACERAHALAAAGEDATAIVARALPDVAPRVVSVPKGVRLEAAVEGAPVVDLRQGSRDPLVVLPAGVRSVKQPRWPIKPLEKLRAEGLEIRYVVLGPELEEAESAALAREFAARPWCSRVEAPPEAAPAALAAADLVINCSRVEGFSNALAEAQFVGCCVLAIDVPGNRAALGSSGVIFADAEDFVSKARSLLRDPTQRRRLGEGAKRDARRRFDPEREIDALLKAYERARAM